MYCEKCSRVYDGAEAVCPVCGSRKVRYPRVDDLCFLVEKTMPWGEMLAGVLENNGIRFLKKPVLGAGLSLNLGRGQERWRIYVPYSQLDKAREILDTMFSGE